MTDHVLADGRWQFDDQVADVFDDMLARSIPDYDTMRRVTTRVAVPFLSHPGCIVDLGASRGEALARLLYERPQATAIAVEVSEPMLAAARSRLSAWPHAQVDRIDLRTGFPIAVDVDVVLAVLTLQFVPIEYRQRILADVYRALRPGGALILVEKILGASHVTNELLVAAYYDRKRENGYTNEEIDRKRLALEGVLVPVTAWQNERWLTDAGFAYGDRIWQSLNFAAWVAVRR